MQRVKCFMVRHQAEGVIHSFVFTKPPTTEETAAVLEAVDVEERHGETHPKNDEAYWTKTHEAILMVPDELAQHFEPAPAAVPKAAGAHGGAAGAGVVGVASPRLNAVGHVTNPADQTPEQAKAAADARAAREAARQEERAKQREAVAKHEAMMRAKVGGETQTITPADVGTVDAATLANPKK